MSKQRESIPLRTNFPSLPLTTLNTAKKKTSLKALPFIAHLMRNSTMSQVTLSEKLNTEGPKRRTLKIKKLEFKKVLSKNFERTAEKPRKSIKLKVNKLIEFVPLRLKLRTKSELVYDSITKSKERVDSALRKLKSQVAINDVDLLEHKKMCFFSRERHNKFKTFYKEHNLHS